jgi:hypothetical protein
MMIALCHIGQKVAAPYAYYQHSYSLPIPATLSLAIAIATDTATITISAKPQVTATTDYSLYTIHYSLYTMHYLLTDLAIISEEFLPLEEGCSHLKTTFPGADSFFRRILHRPRLDDGADARTVLVSTDGLGDLAVLLDQFYWREEKKVRGS